MEEVKVSIAFSVKCVVFSLFVQMFSFITLSSAAATAAFEGNTTDHQALLAFKAKIVHNPQNVMSSWNDSVHFCHWEGIKCGRRHRRVTILHLQSEGLVGSLSPYIGNMSFLREIRLQNNTLQGKIPPELARLFRLQVLHLGNNSFEGEISSNLSHCLNLKYLKLGSNKLIGKIPTELGILSKLTIFAFHDNYLSGGLPPILGNLSSLEGLSAAGNFFSGSIPDSFGQLKYLSIFAVGDNNISGIIPSSIYNISSITVFSVGNNSLHGALPSNIGLLLPHLRILQMTENHFTGSIPVSLSNASKLEEISMYKSNFTGKIDVYFGGLQQLYLLNFYDSSLGSMQQGDNNDLDFLPSLLNCSKLEVLDVSLNQLKGVFPNYVANLSSSSLHLLEIGDNQIYGSLPPWLSTLVSLWEIILQFNQITGTIPMEIGNLPRLQRLYLDSNRLVGQIPSSLGNLSLLIEIQLDDNNLVGSIPSNLGNCHNLLDFSLSYNNLSGFIPKQFFSNHSVLILLDLTGNYLVGSLPSEIGNLFNLNQVYVSQNNLSGEIPNDLSGCNSLEVLDMSDNNFQGILPRSLASLTGLRQFNLSKNNFSGKVPQYLETFALEYLDLSFNNFGGEVPIKGVFANASAISVEGNNKLCGGLAELNLPRCVAEVPKKNKLHHVKIVIISISCVFGVFLLLSFLYCLLRKKTSDLSFASGSLQIKSFQKLSYQMILKATNGFSPENLIGTGSFGSVYKGSLDVDGAVVAIKVLNLQRKGASKTFKAECKALRNIRHRNLVKIITSCSSIDFQRNDFKALVYEFMPNGNLDKWLYPDSQMEHQSLNFLQRINIAIDVGNAIDYLHHNCEQSIIHCDLKPSNILLDNDMVAHVGDFGLVKFLPYLPNSMESSSVGVRGTIGYTAPEYGLGSELSTNGDVYSYGILLLEMIIRKKPTNDIFKDGLNLHNFARMALPDQLLQIVDPILLKEDEVRENYNQHLIRSRNDCKVECLIAMIKIGIACSLESPEDRMDIRNAVNELHSIRDSFIRVSTI